MKKCKTSNFTNDSSTFGGLQFCGGFTLLEMTIAMGVSVFGVLLFSTGFLTISNSAYFVQETATRNSLARSLKNAIMDHRAFQVIGSHNPLVNAVLTNNFAATGPIFTNQFYDISLYNSSGLLISGPPGSPVLYNLDGTMCPAGVLFGQGQCIISVSSSFMVEGVAKWNSLHRMSSVGSLPITGHTTPSYPVSSPALKAELILVNFDITFAQKQGVVDRKPFKGSVFINMRDLGF